MWMLVNANGYSLDNRAPRFEAVVVDGGKIVAVGSTQDLRLQFGSRVTNVVDVAGATVVPGLVDSHLHISGVADAATKLNLVSVRSKQEMLDKIHDYARQLAPDAWVQGGGWNDNLFANPTLPTIEELDNAAGGRPLLLNRICHHAYLANSAAFRLAGVDEHSANPADGKYGRTTDGKLNGLVYENASVPIRNKIPPKTVAEWREAFKSALHTASQAGITAVHTDDVRSLNAFAPVWEIYHQLVREEGIRVRVHELVDWSHIDECNEAMKSLPKPDDWLEIGAAKLFSDGALGGRTAWFQEDYSDAPGWRGQPMYTPEELKERVRIAHEKGFAAAIHAIGDAGLAATVAAFEAAPSIAASGAASMRSAGSEMPVLIRDRLIHAEIVTPELVKRVAALGERCVVDIQPRFTVSDFPWVAERVGEKRLPYTCAWRMLGDAGLHLAGGSDAPIEPIEPLLGMHAAVVRRPPYENREGYRMEQALTPLEAVRLFTHDACFANGSDDRKGVIAPGWFADLTIVDRDIVQPAHADDIRDAKVLFTIVGGEIAYRADGSTAEWSA